MLSPLSREASVGMLFTKATHCEKSLEYATRILGTTRIDSDQPVTGEPAEQSAKCCLTSLYSR
jgi:hypothetical protein